MANGIKLLNEAFGDETSKASLQNIFQGVSPISIVPGRLTKVHRHLFDMEPKQEPFKNQNKPTELLENFQQLTSGQKSNTHKRSFELDDFWNVLRTSVTQSPQQQRISTTFSTDNTTPPSTSSEKNLQIFDAPLLEVFYLPSSSQNDTTESNLQSKFFDNVVSSDTPRNVFSYISLGEAFERLNDKDKLTVLQTMEKGRSSYPYYLWKWP